MTQSEQRSIDQLSKLVYDLRQENQIYRQDLSELVLQINTKVEAKHKPLTLEADILKAAQLSISDSIKAALNNYGSPMQKLVIEVVNEHQVEVKELINSAFKSVIRTDEFKKSIVNAFSHKVARSIISNNDGLFDKVANDLKQDAVFKSRMALAVSNVVDEILNERKDIR